MRTKFFTFVFLTLAFSANAQILGQQTLSQSSYVIDKDGKLWSWGSNFYGQLGVGDRFAHNTPTQVPLPPGVSRWVLVAGGASHAIAIGDSDKLYTWGLNDKGQIGNGTAGGLYVEPVLIKNPLTVKSWKWVSAGTDHCEALDQDGILYAWGNNALGQLGAGNTEYLVSPEVVEFPNGVTAWGAVAAGPGYTMMIAQDGRLYGCGTDSLGTFQPLEGPQLAMQDTFRAYSPLPCLAASFRLESRIDQTYNESPSYFFPSNDGGYSESVAAVANGGWHTLLLTMFGTIAAFGDVTYGQLGIGAIDSVSHASLVPFPSGVSQFVAVAAGLKHSLAIGNDGWLYAWGDDSLGELGIGAAPNQHSPVKVLKVCDPLAMSASFTAPGNFFSGPYSISLSVKNTGVASALTNADAFLLLGGPLTYSGSAPDESVPSPIPPNGSSSVTWDGSGDQEFFDTISPVYFAYVRADGSAPLLWYGTPAAESSGPWKICDEANVLDSLSGIPLPGAQLVFPGPPYGDVFIEPNGPPFDSDKMVSDESGIFSLCFHGPVYDLISYPFPVRSYQFNIMKENYRTTRYTLTEPQREQVTFLMGPSDIRGDFAAPGPQFIADSILKVYYPDSLIGYAISKRVIFRTLDSGIHWSAMYEADTDLHDLKFIEPSQGWVVGDNGEILSTTDIGETWQVTHIGQHNLRALALIDYDTSWAVGDGGTLLKRLGDVWTAFPPLQDSSLTSIHFLDPEDGVIGANGAAYIYTAGIWTRQIIDANLRAVYYVSPDKIFLAGTNGNIIEDSAGEVFIPDSTYTKHTINSLYFLNDLVGYAAGDSGSSFVTYDGGTSWADMSEFPRAATSVNFFSLAGHGVSDDGVLNYEGEPDTLKAIVRGRLTVGDPPIPIIGAEVDRYNSAFDGKDTITTLIDNTYTNEQGNFVFTGIDAIFHYGYHVVFSDSGIAKTKIFPDTLARRHEIITFNYNDYTAPPHDTTLASVNPALESNLSLDVSASQFFAQIEYSIPSDGTVRLVMQDILGRTVRTILDGFSTSGQKGIDVELDDLPSGTYYITLLSGEGSLTKKFAIMR